MKAGLGDQLRSYRDAVWVRRLAAAAERAQAHEPASPYKRHVRFERGGMTVMNAARNGRAGVAWERLARTARQLRP